MNIIYNPLDSAPVLDGFTEAPKHVPTIIEVILLIRGRRVAVTTATDSAASARRRALIRHPGATIITTRRWLRRAANGVANALPG